LLVKPEILIELEKDTMAWGKFFFPHHLNRLPTPKFHLELLALGEDNRYSAVMAPRGSAKTTILQFLSTIKDMICDDQVFFICLVSNTFGNAGQSLRTIIEEFKNNEKLNKYYQIEVKQDAFGQSVVCVGGKEILVRCWGEEQLAKMRGIKFGAYRPNLIVVDDLENDELVRSRDRRNKLKEDFDTALMPCVDIYHKIRVVGTNLHDDSLMADLVLKNEYPEFATRFYQALIDEGKDTERSLWGDRWTVEDLKEIRASKPLKFAKEYQNDPLAGGLDNFKKEDFRYWAIENMDYLLFDESGRIKSRGSLYDCRAAIACDLAWEDKRSADYTVVLPGFLTPDGDILLDNYLCKRGVRPSELEEYLFTLESRLRGITSGTVPIGFEKAKLEKVMKFLLQKAMKRRNRPLYLKDIPWGSDKVERIVSRLQPYYNQHMIYHKRGMGEFEGQLLRIPSGKHDDLPDAAQGLVTLFQSPKKIKKKKSEDMDMFAYLQENCIAGREKPRKGSSSRFYKKQKRSIYKETPLTCKK